MQPSKFLFLTTAVFLCCSWAFAQSDPAPLLRQVGGSAQVNVYADPSTSKIIGTIPADTIVQVGNPRSSNGWQDIFFSQINPSNLSAGQKMTSAFIKASNVQGTVPSQAQLEIQWPQDGVIPVHSRPGEPDSACAGQEPDTSFCGYLQRGDEVHIGGARAVLNPATGKIQTYYGVQIYSWNGDNWIGWIDSNFFKREAVTSPCPLKTPSERNRADLGRAAREMQRKAQEKYGEIAQAIQAKIGACVINNKDLNWKFTRIRQSAFDDYILKYWKRRPTPHFHGLPTKVSRELTKKNLLAIDTLSRALCGEMGQWKCIHKEAHGEVVFHGPQYIEAAAIITLNRAERNSTEYIDGAHDSLETPAVQAVTTRGKYMTMDRTDPAVIRMLCPASNPDKPVFQALSNHDISYLHKLARKGVMIPKISKVPMVVGRTGIYGKRKVIAFAKVKPGDNSVEAYKMCVDVATEAVLDPEGLMRRSPDLADRVTQYTSHYVQPRAGFQKLPAPVVDGVRLTDQSCLQIWKTKSDDQYLRSVH